jgi:hypothetical protein
MKRSTGHRTAASTEDNDRIRHHRVGRSSPRPVTGHARTLIAAALCLLLAGCGLIEIGVSNSPDWCPKPDSKACL